MKITQVLQSKLKIDNLKFGGAERVVRNYHKIFMRYADSTIVHFESVDKIVAELCAINPNVVMCHSDHLTSFLAVRFKNIRFIHISHNPYAELATSSPTNWIKFHKILRNPVEVIRDIRMILGYRAQINSLKALNNVYITALSLRIQKSCLKLHKDGRFYYLPNPIDESDFEYFIHKRNDRYLCVGKIELRKRQYYLQQNLSNIDFVGPGRDRSFNYSDSRYFGELDHEHLHTLMLQYDALVLFSDGEAMPQVVFEAMLCGMRVLLSREASWDFVGDDKLILICDDLTRLDSLAAKSYNDISDCDRLKLRNNIVNTYSVNEEFFYNNYLLPLLRIVSTSM